MLTRRTFTRLGLFSALLAGCGQADSTSSRHLKPTSAAGLKHFAKLPGLRTTTHTGLQAELARLEEEGSTPLQWDAALPKPQSASGNHDPLMAMEQAFPLLSRQLVMQQIAEIYPQAEFILSPPQQERSKELLTRYAAGRKAFAAAIPIDQSGYGLKTSVGFLARHDFLDSLEIGCRLSAIAAADHHKAGDFNAVTQELQTSARAIRFLANEPSLLARTVATNLRTAWCAAVCFHLHSPLFPIPAREHLLHSLREQQAQLSPTSFYFQSERSAGLIVYEWVRHGEFLSLLSSGEIEKLTKQGLLPATQRSAQLNVDHDQFFYLSQMQTILESCDKPHFAREKAFQKVDAALAQQQRQGTYPQVAAKLLEDLKAASRWMGLDETRLASLEIALATSLGGQPQSVLVSPLTGGKIGLETTPEHIVVRFALAPTAPGSVPSAEERITCPIMQTLASTNTGLQLR